ncbi:MAG: 3-hydroxyacyl-ACP dehydratase [Bacteroidia bacterium]|nr:3-hydroxyacyl-ACP dehydratase [Bacteroidia bacterium]
MTTTDTFLLNDFYVIKSIQQVDTKILATIALNEQHAIFKGHFEQMPVVPGVCQTQIIKEILQLQTSKTLTLKKGDNIKFTAMIVPTQHQTVNIEIVFQSKLEGELFTEATLFFNDITFTKFKGTFINSI